jgi:LmbE family N-acetylglucosaminyl deacetylase
MGILTVPAWLFYRRQRLTVWRSTRRKRIYRFAFPVLFTLFLAAYTLRIVFETSSVYKVAEIVLLAMIGALSLLLFWDRPRMQKGSLPDRVLIIGAHPDDIELGAAGAILRFGEEGAQVYGLVMTQGEVGSKAPLGTRENEAYEAAASLGLSGLWVLNFPDTKLREHIAELRAAIEEKIKALGIRVVLTHSPHETHGDHVAVFEAAKEAARACSLLCYESISAPKEFVPNYFVDITRYLPGKISAIGTHKTQSAKFYMNPELVKGRAAHRGLQAGVPYAEAFWVYRWVR